jgi:hypothetical protein
MVHTLLRGRAKKPPLLQDVCVLDLRHTIGMRLREAGVREETILDILWRARGTMTAHYSVAQVRELLDALNLITDENNRSNPSLEMLFREKGRVPSKFLQKKNGLDHFRPNPLIIWRANIKFEP